jgi:hypothetical protein
MGNGFKVGPLTSIEVCLHTVINCASRNFLADLRKQTTPKVGRLQQRVSLVDSKMTNFYVYGANDVDLFFGWRYNSIDSPRVRACSFPQKIVCEVVTFNPVLKTISFLGTSPFLEGLVPKIPNFGISRDIWLDPGTLSVPRSNQK